MKKLFVLVALMLSLNTSFADGPGNGQPVPLTIKTTNPSDIRDPPARGPIYIPTVYRNGNVLTFDEALEGCTVQLLNEDEVIVFADFIGENQTSIVFPATLFGTYELQIVMGNITFYCEIEL